MIKYFHLVPAKIASFDDKFTVTYREDVTLPCQAVGAPLPEVSWKIKGSVYTPSERVRLLAEGSLMIREVTRDDAGEYTCTVENMYGRDTVTHQLQVQCIYWHLLSLDRVMMLVF